MQVKAAPPRKLRLYVLDEESGRPARAVRVEADAETVLPSPVSFDAPAPPSIVHKLGALSTDHVGFVAFALPATKSEPSWSHLWVFPSARPEARFDVLPLFRQTADDVGITVRWKDARAWAENRPSLPSTQEVVIDDWAASQKSFAVSNVEVVGENGCESLLISHAPQHVFLFHQIRRTAGEPTRAVRAMPYPCQPKPPAEEEVMLRVDQTCVRTGLIIEYELAWI